MFITLFKEVFLYTWNLPALMLVWLPAYLAACPLPCHLRYLHV